MANAIVTPNIFAKMTVMNLGGALNIARNMSKEVEKTFGKPKDNKPGAIVQVRKPYRFTVAKGLGYQPQPITDQFFPVKVSQIAQVSFEWDSVERTLSLREVNELYSKPAALALASTINMEAGVYIKNNTFNAVGVPGVTPVDEQPYLAAGDKIVELGLPENEELGLILNRKMSSSFVHGVKTLYNPAGTISKQFQQGQISDATLGYSIYRDQSIPTHVVGTYSGTPLINGANQVADGGNNATMVLATDGWGAGVTTLNQGDIFTLGSATDAVIGGMQTVHPQTRQATGDLAQFVVLAKVSDVAGVISVLVSPAITPSGQYQNVNMAAPDNAIITVLGTSGVSSTTGLLLHKNAFAFVSVPLANPEPNGVEMVSEATDPETGISISFIRQFDGIQRRHINRFDVLYDFAAMYREMACRIQA